MYKNKKISLILPAYNEEDSITGVIFDFNNTGYIDEIIVVDNNSKDKTAQRVQKTKKAKVIKEKKQGYGCALQRGLKEAKGDILVTCDADNTYVASDLKKLLSKSQKYDFVFSTRVNKYLLLPGSRMGAVRRWANITVSKFLSVLFKGPKLTDAGATFRLINRRPYEVIKPYLKTGGINFQPELTILALLYGFKVKEVPVHYGPRTGKSKISGSIIGGMKTAKAMLGLILYYRFKIWLGKWR